VRPPDENQHGSTRPNLLSGARRRFGSDDNILERLERDSARQASGDRSRAAWYAAAASLLLLVLVVVAWMAYENANTVQVIAVTPASGPVPLQQAPAAIQAPALPGPAIVLHMNPHDAALPRQAAIAVPAPAQSNAIASLPPLVLLSGDRAAANKAVAPSRAEAPLPGVSAARNKPAGRATPQALQQAAPARTASRTTTAVRERKSTNARPAQDALIDRDVALLSAIIIHDSAHADEKVQFEAASDCARASERKCGGPATSARK
jgi:hypothetical protein